MDLTKLLLEDSAPLKSPSVPTSFIDCVFCDASSEADLVDPLAKVAPLPFGNSPLLPAELVSGRLLSEGEDVKETIELTIDVKSSYDYLPGDSVSIFPSNRDEEVEALLERLGLVDRCDTQVKLSIKKGIKRKLPPYLPTTTTPKTLLQRVLETRSVLKKIFLRSLAEYAQDPLEKRRLLELTSPEASSDYDKFILQGGVTLNDLLAAFPSCRPPLSLLLEHLPRLTPRAYSIASSPLSHPTRIKIVFNVVHTPQGKVGVCSSWLRTKFEEMNDVVIAKFSELSVCGSTRNTSQNTIPLFFRKPSKFRVPDDLTVPSIMIGPGTGVSPFIGFLEHMRLSKGKEALSDEGISSRLYFGCRYRDKDQIYKSEMHEFLREKLLAAYRTCFSRDRSLDSDPKYVQDLVKTDRKEILNLINNFNANIFVCGDAQNMVKDVLAALKEIIVESSGITEEEVSKKLLDMEAAGQLVKDVWR